MQNYPGNTSSLEKRNSSGNNRFMCKKIKLADCINTAVSKNLH